MRCQRDHVFSSFLNSKALRDKLQITSEDVVGEDFSNVSKHLLIEVIKAMLVAYCNDEPDQTVLRVINNKIKANI